MWHVTCDDDGRRLGDVGAYGTLSKAERGELK